MRNIFEAKKEDNNKTTEQPPANIDIAPEKAQNFFGEYEQPIADYAESAGLTFRRGKGWAIKMETGEATYDPKFFADRGYSAGAAMWATCHEAEHFRDWRRDPEIYAKLFARMKYRRRIHVLYNCLDDIMVNRQVDKRFPSHQETKEGLYRDKLFPGVDYSDKPEHIQLAYAMLREKMLPDEILNLSPKVRAEIDKLKNIDGQGTDLIDLVSDPSAKPADRYEIIRDYIEPIYEKLFQEDLEEKKKKGGGQGGEAGEPSSAEDNFADEYDDFDEKSPQPMMPDEIKDAIDKEIKRRKEAEQSTPEQIADKQFEKQHGISVKEMNDYRRDYEKIKQYIEPLREIFEKIISTRKEIKRRLKERTDQGVIMDPAMISQAFIDAQSGVLDSRTQLKVKKTEHDEHKPNDLEFTLVCDLSGSMNKNKPGGKSYEQRLCAILIMEALNEFEEKLRSERLEKSLDLHVFTEVRGFGSNDEELKPLSDNIEYKTRIKLAKRLEKCDGGSTADYKSLAKIDEGVSADISRKIASGDMKKIILLFTDGGSDDVRQALKEKNSLKTAGIITKAIQIGNPSESDIIKFREVWQKPDKDGYPCKDVSRLVLIVAKLLEEFVNDL
jgi:hypothetical protein